VSQQDASSLRLVATLAVAGLCSGLILVAVYLTTLPRIQKNKAEALEAAILRVLPGTQEISTLVPGESSLQTSEARPGELEADVVYAGRSEAGALVGYAVPAQGPGFMDTIKILYGFNPNHRTVIGMEVLDSRETPGLGDKIIFDPDFLANFLALEVEPVIVAVKKGQKAAANEVDCITGATISSEAIVGILNQSSQRWLPLLTGEEAE
jgi:electron transport complex protein RnfG